MKTNQHFNLSKVIIKDLWLHAKFPIVVSVLIVITALSVLAVTNKTRLLRNQHEQLLIERDAMENEWRNLILEENVLGKHSRIEEIAVSRLKMQKVTPENETIIKIKRAR